MEEELQTLEFLSFVTGSGRGEHFQAFGSRLAVRHLGPHRPACVEIQMLKGSRHVHVSQRPITGFQISEMPAWVQHPLSNVNSQCDESELGSRDSVKARIGGSRWILK